MIMAQLRLLGLLGFGALVLFAGFQTIRAKDLADRNDQLQTDIKNIRAAQALTDQLRRANAILDKDQDDIGDDLRDASGYSDPLPPDVIRVLDRLRPGSAAP